jgi:hypothetical protein
MKIIFLDFDGVMDTAYYDHVLAMAGGMQVGLSIHNIR